jgi:hypothetical protein
MLLESRDIVDAPADLVYPLVRDNLPVVVPYLPNIKSIEVLEREELEEGRVRIVNLWTADIEIPSMLRRVIKPEFLSWHDYALWQDEHYHVDYRLEGAWMKDLYTAKGRNSFKPTDDGKRTEIVISCNVELHPDKIPGVPTFLVRPLIPAIESLLKAVLAPNLTLLAKGVKGYLAAQEGEGGGGAG